MPHPEPRLEKTGTMRRIFTELKRRNVYKVGVTYAVVAFVTLQAAELIFPATTLEGVYDALVVVAFVGFPISLVLAWAFEVTPEGVRRTPAAADAGRPLGRSASTAAVAGVVALGLLAAAAAGGWYFLGGGDEAASGAGPPERSIAVLPFTNLSGTEDAEPYVNGIHDDLLARLSNIADLKVISRTSVMRYRDTELPLPAIADSLGVEWILEGGVQRMGERIQVNAQLIDPRTDTHAWADTYRRDLTAEDVFTLQSEITRRIARSLEARLTSAEEDRVDRQPTENLEAYRLYVQGRTHLDRRTEEALVRGRELFREAIRLDSTYALAWSGLADARSLLAFYGYAPPDTTYPGALEAARRAVELEPNLAEARASLGFLSMSRADRPDLATAFREMEKAVELRPSYAQAHLWLAEIEGALGRRQRALVRAKRAADLGPRWAVAHVVLGWIYWWDEGPTRRALEHVRRAAALEPGYAVAHVDEGLMLLDAGRREEALTAIRRGLEGSADDSFSRALALGALGTAHAMAGDTPRAREMVHRLEEEGAPFFESMIHAATGDEDEAFSTLAGVTWTMVWLLDLRAIPFFDVLRDDPRYDELLRGVHAQMGLNPDGSLPEAAVAVGPADAESGGAR